MLQIFKHSKKVLHKSACSRLRNYSIGRNFMGLYWSKLKACRLKITRFDFAYLISIMYFGPIIARHSRLSIFQTRIRHESLITRMGPLDHRILLNLTGLDGIVGIAGRFYCSHNRYEKTRFSSGAFIFWKQQLLFVLSNSCLVSLTQPSSIVLSQPSFDYLCQVLAAVTRPRIQSYLLSINIKIP